MASSDDECESVPHSVSDYDFVDGNDEPISFTELPVQWGDGERTGGNKEQIFIHGNIDNGLQKIYKQVTVWKFELSEANPEILVLMSKENQWMKLQKPRKSFEDTIRTILITLHSLHFLRKYPETSGRALWDHLSKVFRYEPRPSENDLVDHVNLICEAVKKDEVLAKSKFIDAFLDEKPRKRKVEDVKTRENSGFIVDNDMIDETEEDESDDEEQGDKVCAICDNGGDILCCEGKCLRSFHATIEAGSESTCESLGFSDEQVEAIQNYYCKNCQYKRHQCFACGELGSSDETASAIEVFRCVSGECGRFYHPRCVSKLLHPDSESHAEELEKKINNGASFTCPFHKCYVCKQTETEQHPDLRFAMCRRCPKSYHRKCLPTEICFDDPEDENIIPRAWEKLMPKKRILIYCLEHEIDDELLTPIRNHIKFPGEEKKKKQASEPQSRKETFILKKKSLVLEDASRRKTYVEPPIARDKLSVATKRGDFPKKSDGIVIGRDSSKKLMDTTRKPWSKTSSKFKSTPDENKTSLGDRLYALVSKGSEPIKPKKNDAADGEHDQTYAVKSVAKEKSYLPPLDAASEKRILALMKDATSSITLAEINEKHKVPTTHAYSSKNSVDKTITLGKVEGSVEALRAAVQKLEEGCSIEDAKAVCGPGLLSEMMKWKSKLRVYLAPFLHGMRYTSFGRHFTKLDKLKKVVDMLHWYAQDGDMIVDFCCGANDFSCLMKKRLDEVGKKCSYKNYDVIQPKNDFNFEQRDWMSVQLNELPSGSRLIMGLNPPFGVKASLANKFINKALEFKPKLLVLIVPQETERLDKKNPPYDLVFEDNELLAGKSFYLPGSVDINDKQMDQWNMSPPPLSFWSRQDWTSKHKVIAQQHGDLYRGREVSHMVDNQKEIHVPVSPVEDNKLNLETSTLLDSRSLRNGEPVQLQERATSVAESPKERPKNNDGVSKRPENNDGRNNRSNGNPKKRNRGKGNQIRGSSEILPENKQKSKNSPPSQSQGVETPSFKGKQRRGSSEISPKDNQKSKSILPSLSQAVETPLLAGVGNESYQHSEPHQSGAGYTSKRRRGSSEILPDNRKNKSFMPSQSQAVEITSLVGVGSESYQHFDGRVSEPPQLVAGYTGTWRRGSSEISHEDNQKSYSVLPSQSQAVEAPSLAGFGNESYQHFDGRVSEQHQFGAGYAGTWRRGLSDISPEDNHRSYVPSQSQAVETPSLTGVGNESYQHFDGRVSEPHPFGAGYTGTLEDSMARRHGSIGGEPYQSSTIRNRFSEEQISGYQRGGVENRVYIPSQRSSYLDGHNPRVPTPYGNLGSVPDSSYSRMSSTSTMQRYAPRLDELNYSRMNSLRSEPPSMTRSGVYDPLAPRPFYQGQGFPPGPYFPSQ